MSAALSVVVVVPFLLPSVRARVCVYLGAERRKHTHYTKAHYFLVTTEPHQMHSNRERKAKGNVAKQQQRQQRQRPSNVCVCARTHIQSRIRRERERERESFHTHNTHMRTVRKGRRNNNNSVAMTCVCACILDLARRRDTHTSPRMEEMRERLWVRPPARPTKGFIPIPRFAISIPLPPRSRPDIQKRKKGEGACQREMRGQQKKRILILEHSTVLRTSKDNRFSIQSRKHTRFVAPPRCNKNRPTLKLQTTPREQQRERRPQNNCWPLPLALMFCAAAEEAQSAAV